MTSKIKRGDIYWASPDEERSIVAGLAHPHVVVQDDVFNQSRITTTVICALTSNLKRVTEPGNVMLELGEAGLDKQSVVVVSQISSIPKKQLGEFIGHLSDERVMQILAGIRFQQKAFFKD